MFNNALGSHSRLRRGPWVAYAAALWACVFATFHIIWAAGSYPLLDDEQTRVAFATPWKWAFDVVVAGICVVAVPVALAPVMSWGQHVPRRLIYTLAWIGTTLLILRAVASLFQAGYLVAVGRFSARSHGHLGTVVLPGCHSVQPEHVACETLEEWKGHRLKRA